MLNCIMQFDAMKIEIGELVSIQAGFPFRGAIGVLAAGSVLAVQMKDLDAERGIDWTGVIRTELTGRKSPDWLQLGDVLFVSRGTRFYAVCVDTPPGPAVCGPHFFHLRVKPKARLLPAFLAWQINQPPFQRQLWQAAEGSSQLSIRRPVLEALSISLPGLPDQQRIVALAGLARQEREALHQLIRNRQLQLEALAENLASKTTLTHVPYAQSAIKK